MRKTRLKFAGIIRRRLFTGRHRHSSFGQRLRPAEPGGAFTHVGPLHFAERIDNVGDWRRYESRPVAFIFSADGANQLGVGVGEQSNRIGVQGNMRSVFLAIPRNPFKKFLAFFRRVDADAEDLNISFKVSFPLVDKGRHLGPAPGSPAAAVKENNSRGGLGEDGGKCNRHAVDVFERRCGKLIADR